MGEIIDDIVQKMMAEDPWLTSDNGSVSLIYLGLPEGVSITDIIDENIVESAELDTVNPDYKDSAALHCFLATLYQALPRELSYEVRRKIELEKLKREEDPRLLKCINMSPAEIAEVFSDETIYVPFKEGGKFAVNFEAAYAYGHLCNIRSYMSSKNVSRTYHHYKEALKLTKDNPTVFKHMIEPIVLAYMTPILLGEIIGQKDGNLNRPSAYPLLGWLNDEYKSAKQRLGVQQHNLLPPISTARPTPF